MDGVESFADNCPAQFTVTDSEPQVKFFSYPGCAQKSMALSPGNYPDLNSPNMGIGRNDIDSLVIPGNMTVTGFERPFYNADCPTCKKVTLSGGIYSDLNNPFLGLGQNDMDSITIVRNKTWDQFKSDCCQNQGNREQCGQFWGGNNTGACTNLMTQTCNAGQMGNNTLCRTWCIANPGACDQAMTQYCASNPNDPICGCLVSKLKAPACFDRVCLTAPGYRTKTMADVSVRCPTVIECNQNVIIDKNSYNNIVSDLHMTQTCFATDGTNVIDDQGTGSPNVNVDPKDYIIDITPNPKPGSNSGSVSSSMPLILLLLLVVVAVIMAVLFSGGDNDTADDYDYGYDEDYGY